MLLNPHSILRYCEEILTTRKTEYQRELENLSEAAAGEVKSSAGDKYETGREMIAQSRNIIEKNLSETLVHLDTLERLRSSSMRTPNQLADPIQFGSLVETTQGWYFLGISLGEIEIGGVSICMISMASPLGITLRGKKVGEVVQGRNAPLKILQVG